MRPNWFIALPLPSASWFEARVTAFPPAGVRRFSPSDLHFTVAFLGGVEEEEALRAWEEARAAPTVGPLSVGLGPVELFGHPARGTALATTVDAGREALVALIADRRAGLLAAAGAPPDRRPPRPHATLARIQRRASPPQRRRALAWAASLDLSAVVVALDRIALYTWADDRPHRQFRVVADAPL